MRCCEPFIVIMPIAWNCHLPQTKKKVQVSFSHRKGNMCKSLFDCLKTLQVTWLWPKTLEAELHSFNFTQTKLSNFIIHPDLTHEEKKISPFLFHLIKRSRWPTDVGNNLSLSNSLIFAPLIICFNNVPLELPKTDKTKSCDFLQNTKYSLILL